MAELNTQKCVIYKKAPVVERVIGAFCAPDPDLLTTRMEDWTLRIKALYPEVETVTNVTIQIDDKDGVPQLGAIKPTIQLWHLHWRLNKAGEKCACIQTRPDGFFVNIRRDSDGIHTFGEIFGEFQHWLPQWQETFSVSHFHGCQLHYVNELSEVVTPQFVSEDKSLLIGNAIRVFSSFVAPGPFGTLVLPYECQATLQLEGLPGATMHLHTKANKNEEGKPPVIIVEIRVQSRSSDQRIGLPNLIDQCKVYHDALLGGFRSVFTEEALKSFDPVEPS